MLLADIRTCLAAATTGSLSAAARQPNVAPTLKLVMALRRHVRLSFYEAGSSAVLLAAARAMAMRYHSVTTCNTRWLL